MQLKFPSFLLGIAFVTIGSLGVTLPASANWWAGAERSGTCFVPNNQTSFDCQYGNYRVQHGARQISGFYVNPTNNVRYTGQVSIQYRTRGGGFWAPWGNWQTRNLRMNATQGNYIDFGNGVQEFQFRIVRTRHVPLNNDMVIKFKMNYDLDR